jgi:hypothetical protein
MRKITIFFNLTLAIFCLASLTAVAVAAEKKQPTKAPATQTAPATKAVPANSITQAAMKTGIKSCAGRINQVTNFLAAGVKDAGYMMFYPKNKPDQQMTSISMELPLKDNTAYASASFAPGQENYCGGMYETVVYWPNKCPEVAEKQFGALKKAEGLAKNIGVRDGGESMKVFLMPAGTGCVSIKKEIVR